MNDKILHSPLRFPAYFDNETKHLLQGLLSKGKSRPANTPQLRRNACRTRSRSSLTRSSSRSTGPMCWTAASRHRSCLTWPPTPMSSTLTRNSRSKRPTSATPTSCRPALMTCSLASRMSTPAWSRPRSPSPSPRATRPRMASSTPHRPAASSSAARTIPSSCSSPPSPFTRARTTKPNYAALLPASCTNKDSVVLTSVSLPLWARCCGEEARTTARTRIGEELLRRHLLATPHCLVGGQLKPLTALEGGFVGDLEDEPEQGTFPAMMPNSCWTVIVEKSPFPGW